MIDSEDVAALLVPVIILIATSVAWLVFHLKGFQPALVLMCLAGIPLLVILLVAGLPYYHSRPFAGLVTSLCLLLLFPMSVEAVSADAWVLISALLCGLVGGWGTIRYLIKAMVPLYRPAWRTLHRGDSPGEATA